MLPLTLIVLAAACARDHYQLTELKNGEVIRLDTQSGALTLLEGSELHVPDSVEDHPADSDALAKRRAWPVLGAPLGLDYAKTSLATSWRAGQLRYDLRLDYPDTGRGGDGTPGVYYRQHLPNSMSLIFLDADNFVVRQVLLDPGQLVGEQDTSGVVRAREIRDEIPFEAGDYRRVAGWSFSWR